MFMEHWYCRTADGYPDAWVTSDGKTGTEHAANPCHYPNDQAARTLWYHDHALGTTRLNIYAGLAGFYIIRDEDEEALNLPKGNFEIPLMIQDRTFRSDGSLVYPTGKGRHPTQSGIQEFFGENICVNGKRHAIPRSGATQISFPSGKPPRIRGFTI